jgi:RNA polymerase sigma-70 factor (ECF subfamily)
MINWPALVREEGPRVWRIAFALLGNHADAADCMQETFTQALEVSKREPVRNWPGLLHRLATVQGLARLRSRYRDKNRRGDFALAASTASSDAGPVEQAELAELTQGLRQALASLSPQEATIFCLHGLQGQSYQEIGAQLNLGVCTVGVILHRARARLRELLAAFLAKPA